MTYARSNMIGWKRLSPFPKCFTIYGTKYSRMDQVKFVKDSLWRDMVCYFYRICLPQILIGPFLNTLSFIWVGSENLNNLPWKKSFITTKTKKRLILQFHDKYSSFKLINIPHFLIFLIFQNIFPEKTHLMGTSHVHDFEIQITICFTRV